MDCRINILFWPYIFFLNLTEIIYLSWNLCLELLLYMPWNFYRKILNVSFQKPNAHRTFWTLHIKINLNDNISETNGPIQLNWNFVRFLFSKSNKHSIKILEFWKSIGLWKFKNSMKRSPSVLCWLRRPQFSAVEHPLFSLLLLCKLCVPTNRNHDTEKVFHFTCEGSREKCLFVSMPTHCTIMRFGFRARRIDGVECGLFSNHAPLGQTTLRVGRVSV